MKNLFNPQCKFIKHFSTSFNCLASIPINLSNKAIKTYLNPILQRPDILKDNKGKSGIYCWFNLVNGIITSEAVLI